MEQSVLKTEPLQKTDSRNYGIDLLKIISMFMVVVLHVLGRGGVLNSSEPNSLNWYVAWTLEIGAYCAVNCFAMTTGYLMVNKRYKSSRIISLWIQVVFYMLIMTALMKILYPAEIGLSVWIKSLLPVTFESYWYVSSYFALFFLIPFINKAINRFSQKENTIIILVCVALFSIVSTISNADPFSIEGGYSTIWLAFMYLIGAYVKKYEVLKSVKKRWFALAFLGCIGLTVLSIVVLKFLTVAVFGSEKAVMILVGYQSPTIVLAAFSLLMFCTKLTVNKLFFKKLLTFLSPLAFGVYIIHCHVLIWNKLLENRFISLANANVFVLIGVVIASAIVIYLACTVIEIMRYYLFKLCRVETLASKVGDKIDDAVRNFGEKRFDKN